MIILWVTVNCKILNSGYRNLWYTSIFTKLACSCRNPTLFVEVEFKRYYVQDKYGIDVKELSMSLVSLQEFFVESQL